MTGNRFCTETNVPTALEFDDHRALIKFLVESRLQLVKHFHRSADNFHHLALRESSAYPCHPCHPCHPWLKGKAQHFDRRGDFNVLVADDKIQRAGA